jgi:hypothetical protein
LSRKKFFVDKSRLGRIITKTEYYETVEAEITTIYAPYRESGGLRAGWRCGLLNGLPRAWSKMIADHLVFHDVTHTSVAEDMLVS